ncbi:protein croquemort-like [Coccinella septempunctata]|uniref:protein croquemort-like n=1 Tax=Coccinella septempunctata TaxID=41139 RepID=UPI001D0967F5|nr:protein croquemort-like [Coccinella septempunctata]XP_044754136.1 protein croquemort-like [Coccinella septempunctata]
MKVNKGCRKYLEPALSGFVLIIGMVLLNIHKKIVDIIIDEFLVLKPNTYYFSEWKDAANLLPIEFYFFNWTNPEDLFNPSVKPKFQEVGPIVMNQETHRWNITINENNTVTYRNKKVFFLDEEKSKAALEDNVTSVNVVPMFASEKARNWNFFYRKGLAIAIRDSPYHKTTTIKEWLFDGYEDSLLETASYLPFLDDMPNYDRVAWFYKRNDSEMYEGVFNMGTGLGNTTIGKTYRWNYRNITDYSGYCGQFQATSELFPQNPKKDKIEFFSSDFCRKIIFYYNGTVSWKGLEAYKYVGEEDFLDTGKYNKKNTCFCLRKCLKYGVSDYSKCSYGLPSYVSLPHFTRADPKYRDDIEGMRPNGSKHNLEIWLHPRTGTLLVMTLGVQMNMYMEPNPSISKFKDVPELMIPLFWFYADYQLDFRNMLLVQVLDRLEAFLRIISYILIISGAAIHIRFFYHYLHRREEEKHANLSHCPEHLKLMTHTNGCDKY